MSAVPATRWQDRKVVWPLGVLLVGLGVSTVFVVVSSTAEFVRSEMELWQYGF